MHRLTIIGAGSLGKTLGRLWSDQGILAIGDILNRSTETAQRAASFIGAGRVVSDYAALQPAGIFLIATPDDAIADCAGQLAQSGCLIPGSVVFHCSGALSSEVLRPAQQAGAAVASIHPIRSFAVPEQVVQAFTGTWCGMEGDPHALAVLRPAFTAIGAQLVAIRPECKALYHSAAVFASNYLVTLLDVALQAYEKAGIPRATALHLLAPLVRGSVDNVLCNGPEQALSGPVARGDVATVVRQYRAVMSWNKRYGTLYKQLAKCAAALAARRSNQA